VYNLLLLTKREDQMDLLIKASGQFELDLRIESEMPSLDGEIDNCTPDAVVLDVGSMGNAKSRQFIDECHDLKLPVVLIFPGELVEDYDPSFNPDEFMLSPVNPAELVARVGQAIYRVNGPPGDQILKAGELVIDLERYDVTMSGRRVSLTYKEFQLLVLLASNPGRVYSREMLLSQIWGYDYLGGTRTVDVHVRRLRSKIEDPNHLFVETIWNVGYRFTTQM